MPAKCDEHSGVCTRVEGIETEVSDLKSSDGEQWKEIRKRPATATLLIVVGIIASAVLTIVGLVYESHQGRMTKLEQTDAIIFKRLDDQYEKITNKLDELKDSVLRESAGRTRDRDERKSK